MIEDADGDIDVSGSLAEVLSISELETEVVGGGHDVSNPSTSSEDTIPSVVDGFTEGLWEDSGVGLLKEGETEEGNVVSLNARGERLGELLDELFKDSSSAGGS